MAILSEGNLTFEIGFIGFESCNYLEYYFRALWNNTSLFNPALFADDVQNGRFYGNYLYSQDTLIGFFKRIVETRNGGSLETGEPPFISIEIETWNDKKDETMRRWEGKTVLLGDGVSVEERPYSEGAELFLPLFENSVKFTVHFDNCFLKSGFKKSKGERFSMFLETNFEVLARFVVDLEEEYVVFQNEFADTISKLKHSGNYY